MPGSYLMSAACKLFGYCMDLLALITISHHLYDTTGDAEAFGLALVLSSFCGLASIVLLSKVLDLVAKLNSFMQKQSS